MRLKKLHFISSLFLFTFISAHLLNHFIAVFSFEDHISTMNFLRTIYRNPVIEILLMALILFQIVSGFSLFLMKKKSVKFLDHLQSFSGLYLSLFFIIHILAVMVARFHLKLDTNIYFGVAGLNTFPYLLFFIPYYSLAIFSFFAHIATVHAKKMTRVILGVSVIHQAYLILCIGVIFTVAVLYSLTAGFQGVILPDKFKLERSQRIGNSMHIFC